MTAPLLHRLIGGILAKPIRSEDREHAALLVLDAVANILAGRTSDPGQILLRFAKANTPQDTARRALLWGGLAHILETDDLHRASVVHPGCVVVPAAWSVAAKVGATGHALLDAVIHGFEAATRVGMAVGPAHYQHWHNTATCGPYGSSMAASTLLSLSPDQTLHALGNAGAQSFGLWQFLHTGAMTKHLHAGRAAEAGVLAAELAKLGFTGPPDMLEGAHGWFAATCPDADPKNLLRDLDAPWQIHQTSFKPWPSCRHTHPAIEAAQSLRAHTIDWAHIARVEIDTYPAAIAVCDQPIPETDYAAKFSLQHTVAAALSFERIDFLTFSAATRTALSPHRKKVHLRLSERYASAYPKAWGSAVTVILQDGTARSAASDHAKGDPEHPLSRTEIIDKARLLMQHGTVRDPDRLIETLLALPDNGPLPGLPVRCGYGHGWTDDG